MTLPPSLQRLKERALSAQTVEYSTYAGTIPVLARICKEHSNELVEFLKECDPPKILSLLEAYEVLLGACKSVVGCEPFGPANPHIVSEALSKADSLLEGRGK